MPPHESEPFNIVGTIDLAAKIIGVVAGTSVLLGITFNVAFFAFTKPQWLFYLSVSDNVSATLFALPVTFVLIAGLLALAATDTALPTRLPWAGRWWNKALYFTMPFVLSLGVVSFTPGGMTLASASAVGLGASLVFIPWVARVLIVEQRAPGLSRVARWIIVTVLLLAVLMAGSVILALGAACRTAPLVEVEIPGKLLVRGTLIRPLESGIILAQGKSWLWLPRSDIRRVTEVEPDAASNL